ncbi:MAG: TlpA family protein disulfide reductase [Chitinophagaceae bacterium]|nr:MAG: TlpA family protein disulfide reductase [Chitinophagaceae bacterium]
MRTILLAILIIMLTFPSAAQQVRAVKITELESIIRDTDHPLIVNFWATWCLPCIEEIPWFTAQAAAHKKDSLELLLVSLDMKDDFPGRIDSFLLRRKLQARVLWLDEHDADYFCPKIDSKWSGAIPASLFINPAKGYRRFYSDQLSEAQLVKAIREML